MKLAPLLLVLVSVTQAAAGTSQPVLLDFHADWCGPCRQMRPAVQKLADKGYPIKSIDVDRSPEMAEKYGIGPIPTFVVVDADGREIDRVSGAQPASQLAQFYIKAKDKAKASARSRGDDEDEAAAPAEDDPDAKAPSDDEPQAKPENERLAPKPHVNPKPWETVVRIKVHANGSIGYGSGTIIYSSPEESLVLTCAHIFKLDGSRQAPPNKFPRKITIDLFDGRPQGREKQVHPIETVAGEAVDYDFKLDVGLIRIRPGRRLPASRVVPPHWEPLQRMGMTSVGCSEGADATTWRTQIVDPKMRGLSGNTAYEAIECMKAPKQGRSGGGLYTDNGYIAGVCNFAEPRGDRGLYATPNSIYSILDRNKLAGLYASPSIGSGSTLMADRGGKSPMSIARGQSPDHEEPVRAATKEGDVTIPDPEIVLGIKAPLQSGRNSRVQAASSTGDRRLAWHPRGGAPTPKLASIETIEPTDIGMDSATDNDHFPPPDWDRDDDERDSKASLNTEDVAPQTEVRKPVAGKPSGWRPSRSSSVGAR
ncbi:MAG: thioredoxin domain-containing protein [Paludisphaera borealis]|uniref:thioredoxin domain-containing protein n=1 Tax=Paludisphaera borealis TaxID=1387353 RepID=UPI00284C0F60|nr:thioredoxin domain-containing protein [Paludisphaera borealis]MDR3622107.1 thioredoxin domain-containing protein [Paludisphaera borealis]